tara:strand:- start:250 stop:942 length:693 start_codon:yes stop_codon:yes gene_type:complete
MINSHWTHYGTKKSFVPKEDKFGFVYIITNTKNGKAYVGCKQYYSMNKKKTKHKWEIYTGSSKYLNADIKKIGKEHFTFEVIAEYKNKRSLQYYEVYYQMKWDVLTAVIEGTDEPAFYNSYVGGKFYRPVESYKDTAGDKHYFYKGKAEFYLDGKRMVVDCLSSWAEKNNYNKGALNAIATTYEKGYCGYQHPPQKVTKRKRFKHKGPLGTITKVRRLKCKDIIKVEEVK